MTYVPGHNVWVGYSLEAGAITESPNGTTPAAIAAANTSLTYLGYMDVPESTEDYGNKKGFSIGSPLAQYSARGNVMNSLSFQLRVGASGFLPYCLRDASFGDYGMQPLTIYVGVAGSYTDIYRYCYVDTLGLSLQEGSAQEVTAAVTIQAMAKQPLQTGAYLRSPTNSELSGPFAAPLMFHDIKQFIVTARDASTVDYRSFLMGANLNIAHGLERKGSRPNWGDDEVLSRTCYEIMPHLVTVTGELTLHDRLPEKYFTTAIQSQNWGDIIIPISDSTGIDAGAPNTMDLVVTGAMPTSRTTRGTEAGAQVSHSISIVADDLTIN